MNASIPLRSMAAAVSVAAILVFLPAGGAAAQDLGACCHGNLCSDGVSAAACNAAVGGTFAGAATSCSNPGVCSSCGDGALQYGEECDDGNDAAGDGCGACTVEACWTCETPTTDDGTPVAPTVCTTDNTASCDDGDACTLGDRCVDGQCGGTAPVIPAACHWAIVAGGNGVHAESHLRGSSSVVGSVCGRTTRVDDRSVVHGDVVATAATGKGALFGNSAIIEGCIVTGGADIASSYGHSDLPGLSTDLVASGTCRSQANDPERLLDATGPNRKSAACQDAIDDIRASAKRIDSPAFPVTIRNVVFRIPANVGVTFAATKPVTVIDFVELTAGEGATITLDGRNIPGVAFVLRVNRRLYLRSQSRIVLAGGADASRVVIYSRGRCKLGSSVSGAGTLLCPNRMMKIESNASWKGAFVGGENRVDVRHHADLIHVPLVLGLPKS